MNVTRTGDTAFTAAFESEQEVRDEHQANLSFGALRLATSEKLALDTKVEVILRGPWGGEIVLRGFVVAALADGIALGVEGDPDEILGRLLARPQEEQPGDDGEPESPATSANVWDRVRRLSQIEKIFLAVKADRTERSLLLQDNDPRVLLSLLRNPRLTVDEVARLAKSSFLTFQIAEVIMKTSQWMASLDVRLGLIRNPKTPQAFALRILPSLPDSEVRAIARAGTSMALKQAALRRMQGK
ncbi:MAG TPA: hypothetical protein VF701_07940 [Thermoanaerobaculia bacterium]